MALSLADYRERKLAKDAFGSAERRIAAIKTLAREAARLEAELNGVFGVEIKTQCADFKTYQLHTAKYPERVVIHSHRQDMLFALTAGGQYSREAAIAALYYRMTMELMSGQTIRRYDEGGARFDSYGYSRTYSSFYKIDTNSVVAQRKLAYAS